MAKFLSPPSTMRCAFAPKKKENWPLTPTHPKNCNPKKIMKRIIMSFGLIALMGSMALSTRAADAAPPKPSVEDRLADLEAYVTNGARQTNAPTALAASPGPGHNAWQMTSTGLVLFMTLPGLALFY